MSDLEASRYCWYMTDNPETRIVRWVWEPTEEPNGDMTMGEMFLQSRDKSTDPWEILVPKGSPKKTQMNWLVARKFAESNEFDYMDPEYDDVTEPEAEIKRRAEELSSAMRDVTEMSKKIVEHPEILDQFNHVQIAWLMEYYELLLQETKKLQKNLERLKERK